LGFSRFGEKTGVWELTIDRLPPRAAASVTFLTFDEHDATNYISLANTEFRTNGASISMSAQGTTNGEVMLHNLTTTLIVNTGKVINTSKDWRLGTNELRFSYEGEYWYPQEGKSGSQHFLVPLVFESTDRKISSLPARPNDGGWRRVILEFQ
jgi:hypothetical protein